VNVPLLDLTLQYDAIRDDVLAALSRVCDSQRFILGAELEAFEAEITTTVGAPHAIGVSSGTDALLVALMALGIERGDDVIVPTFSFVATGTAVVRLGGTPVFVDVDPRTLTVDPEAVRAALTPRTRAIVPVHLYGLCADMAALGAVAAEAGVPLVEDAAQAIGASAGGRPAGALGRIGCFSFYPTKNLGAFGDAGLVTTDDADLADQIRQLRHQGASARYRHERIGGNFRLDEVQAAVLRVKLRHLASWNEARRRHAARYTELLAAARPAAVVALPHEPAGRVHVYHQYVVRVREREALRRHLAARGVGTEVYYPIPLHRQPCFEPWGSGAACPEADRAADDVLALPVYPELTPAQLEHVVDALAGFVP